MLRYVHFGIRNKNFKYAHPALPVGPDVSQTLVTLNSLQSQMSFLCHFWFCWGNESLIVDNALFGANIDDNVENF